MTRDEVIAEARTYVASATPWRNRGRTRQGVDCVGLLCVVADRFEQPYTDLEAYSRLPNGDHLVEHLKNQLVLVRPPLKRGMVVVLRDNHLPCHVGILGERHGRLTLIHSTLERRRVVEEAWHGFWETQFRCALDYPGVED